MALIKNKGIKVGLIIGIVLAVLLMVFHNLVLSMIQPGGPVNMIGGMLILMFLLPLYCPNLPKQGATDQQMQACIDTMSRGPWVLAMIVIVFCVLIGYGIGEMRKR